LTRLDPSASRDAAAIRAAKTVISNAQGEYEQMEKEREREEAMVTGGAAGEKRELDDEQAGDRAAKRVKSDANGDAEDEEEMEIEMDEDDEGESVG
jgi:hypothetical protein